MGEIKTQLTDADADAFLAAVPDDVRRSDGQAVAALMAEVTGEPPRMWGPSIVGFGSCTYRDASGKGREWFPVGFSPRKAEIALYLLSGQESYAGILERLGTCRTGTSCIYIKRLSDVDPTVLRELITRAWEDRPTD